MGGNPVSHFKVMDPGFLGICLQFPRGRSLGINDNWIAEVGSKFQQQFWVVLVSQRARVDKFRGTSRRNVVKGGEWGHLIQCGPVLHNGQAICLHTFTKDDR